MKRLLLCICITLVGAQNPSDPCRSTIGAIASRETFETESRNRIYKLCPSTYKVATLDWSNRLINGDDMIPLRSNLTIQCAGPGPCIVQDGSVLVDGTTSFGVRNARIDNVVIEGITFQNATKYAVWANKPGSITFRKCEFRDINMANVPVFLDHFDSRNPASQLSVTFEECIFDRNVFNGTHRAFTHNRATPIEPAHPALVVAQGKQNRLTFDRVQFNSNDMMTNDKTANSYLIETTGPITVRESCFSNNRVSTAPVVQFGNQPVVLQDNFGPFGRGGRRCDLHASFSTVVQVDRFLPVCGTGFDSSKCLAEGTAAPTSSPSAAPTSPTPMPSSAPSSTRSISPTLSRSPSDAPSFFPTASPSLSAVPTGAPSLQPSGTRPTATPTSAPSSQPSIEPTTLEPTNLGGDRSGIEDQSSASLFSLSPFLLLAVVVVTL